jgi:hypothetical protein
MCVFRLFQYAHYAQYAQYARTSLLMRGRHPAWWKKLLHVIGLRVGGGGEWGGVVEGWHTYHHTRLALLEQLFAYCHCVQPALNNSHAALLLDGLLGSIPQGCV